ncbi:MAG TPA: hypothetical protein PKH77_07535 [Anaerolineae bacterium]|nr:hypothetical protein [Anaerolineae bacterium]
MNILHQDDHTLILRPGDFWLLLLAGLVFGGIGLLLVGMTGTESRLACERAPRAAIACRLTRTLLGLELDKEPLNDLQGARLHVSHRSKRDTYRVILITAAGERNFTPYGSSWYNTHNRIVTDINTFMKSPNLSQLDVSQGGVKDMWIGAIFFLVGGGTFIGCIQMYFTTWTFDRIQGLVTHRRETLLGVKIAEYPLRDITGAQVGWSRSSKGGITYRVELLTREGAPIPMTHMYSTGKSGKDRAAQVISAFLQQ